MLKKLIATTSALVLMSSAPAFAATQFSAEGVVERASQKVQSSVSDGTLDDQEASELLELLDVDAIGLFALGQNARTADEADLAAYQSAFRGFLADQLQKHLSDLKNVSFEIGNTIERAADDMIVETKVTGDVAGDLDDVNWRLKKAGDTWKVVDIEAKGFWLAIEQRAQFDAKLQENNGDVAALAAALK